MTARARATVVGATLALAIAGAAPVDAYLKLGFRVGTRTVSLKWNRFPIRYFVTNRDVPGVNAAQLRSAVDRAFGTWQAVPSGGVSSQFVGFTSAQPYEDDGMTVLGFQDRPDLDWVLGATTFLVDTRTGEIVESDIFFNATFPWSVATGGESGRVDLESIAVHEIGHLLGLGHSALGETELLAGGGRRVIAAEAVMFPIAYSRGNIEDRALKADDIAGLSDIYAADNFRTRTGSISGRVTRTGRGVYGAHVVAFNLQSGAMVGGFSLEDDGSFVIAGLTPGVHVVRVEPLDDGDLDSFFDDTASVGVDFAVSFLNRLAMVPAGGAPPRVEIAVRPK